MVWDSITFITTMRGECMPQSQLNVLRIAHASHLTRQMIFRKLFYRVQTAPEEQDWYKSFIEEKLVRLLNTLRFQGWRHALNKASHFEKGCWKHCRG